MGKDFDESFSFYLSYHSNHVNQWIHIFFVWPILFTAQILLAYTPAFNQYLPEAVLTKLPPNLSVNINLLFTARYAFYYMLVEQPGIAGVIASALVVLGYLFSTHIVQLHGDIWKIAALIHVFSWAAQIFGHQVFEKRSPAFLDNLSQALMSAPLFVLVEVMHGMFGYKDEFVKKMQVIANENIKQFRASKENKKK